MDLLLGKIKNLHERDFSSSYIKLLHLHGHCTIPWSDIAQRVLPGAPYGPAKMNEQQSKGDMQITMSRVFYKYTHKCQ